MGSVARILRIVWNEAAPAQPHVLVHAELHKRLPGPLIELEGMLECDHRSAMPDGVSPEHDGREAAADLQDPPRSSPF